MKLFKFLARFRKSRQQKLAEPSNKADVPLSASMGFGADKPITQRSEDRFSRWVFAKRVADAVRSREETSGLVIGIYGAWGDGKTSVLNMLKEVLDEGGGEDVVTVGFNPWYFSPRRFCFQPFLQLLQRVLVGARHRKLKSSERL